MYFEAKVNKIKDQNNLQYFSNYIVILNYN